MPLALTVTSNFVEANMPKDSLANENTRGKVKEREIPIKQTDGKNGNVGIYYSIIWQSARDMTKTSTTAARLTSW